MWILLGFDFVKIGLSIFNMIMNFVQDMLTVLPSKFMGGGMWGNAISIAQTLIPIAQPIVIITFLISLYNENLAEGNKMLFVRLTLRFALAETLMIGSMFIIQIVVSFGNWIIWEMSKHLQIEKISFGISEEVKKAMDALGTISFATFTFSIGIIILEILFFIICISSSLVVVLVVLVRFFKIMISVALAPIPLSFAGAGAGHEFSKITSRFIINFLGLSFQTAVIWICFLLYSIFLQQELNIIPVPQSSTENLFIVVAWMITTIIHMILLVVLVKGAEKLSNNLGFT